jgi:2-polyprenyl-6-hydroxyphenyl methylase/3-demethylubiquinone-9 3-methyltransferase
LCAQRGAEVTGIDQSECAVLAATHAAKEQGLDSRCKFIVGREVLGGSYDLVISKDVIEHISDDDGWVRSVAHALNPSGLFICATQNSWCLTFLLEGGYHRVWRRNKSWMGWDPTHVRFYNPLTLGKLLRRHGLRVSKWASLWIIPYNIVTWLTLLKVDITLPWLSYFDYWFGHSFPFNRFGFGLIVIATKHERSNTPQ